MIDIFASIFNDAFKDVSLPKTNVDTVLTNVLNTAYAAIGIVAVGFIIYGGITYATSVGDPNKVKKASHTILYAVVGLVVVMLAAAITNFVLRSTQ